MSCDEIDGIETSNATSASASTFHVTGLILNRFVTQMMLKQRKPYPGVMLTYILYIINLTISILL